MEPSPRIVHAVMIGSAVVFLYFGICAWISIVRGPTTSPAFELGTLSFLAAIALAVIDLVMLLAESEC